MRVAGSPNEKSSHYSLGVKAKCPGIRLGGSALVLSCTFRSLSAPFCPHLPPFRRSPLHRNVARRSSTSRGRANRTDKDWLPSIRRVSSHWHTLVPLATAGSSFQSGSSPRTCQRLRPATCPRCTGCCALPGDATLRNGIAILSPQPPAFNSHSHRRLGIERPPRVRYVNRTWASLILSRRGVSQALPCGGVGFTETTMMLGIPYKSKSNLSRVVS